MYHLVPNDVLQDEVVMELVGLQQFPVENNNYYGGHLHHQGDGATQHCFEQTSNPLSVDPGRARGCNSAPGTSAP